MAETVLGVIPDARLKVSLLKSEPWVLVVTDQRLIGARITDGLRRIVAEQARAEAKTSGSGFLGQWEAQLKGRLALGDRYRAMTPEAILAETPGNWALWPGQVSSIKVERRKRTSGDDDVPRIDYLRITIEAAGGKGTYDTNDDMPSQREVQALLARVFGRVVS
ncbi:MAG: hypothetical protein ABSA21_08915 [Candidatus Limnocylindrales bacterium]|jgi:hypothetical protein